MKTLFLSLNLALASHAFAAKEDLKCAGTFFNPYTAGGSKLAEMAPKEIMPLFETFLGKIESLLRKNHTIVPWKTYERFRDDFYWLGRTIDSYGDLAIAQILGVALDSRRPLLHRVVALIALKLWGPKAQFASDDLLAFLKAQWQAAEEEQSVNVWSVSDRSSFSSDDMLASGYSSWREKWPHSWVFIYELIPTLAAIDPSSDVIAEDFISRMNHPLFKSILEKNLMLMTSNTATAWMVERVEAASAANDRSKLIEDFFYSEKIKTLAEISESLLTKKWAWAALEPELEDMVATMLDIIQERIFLGKPILSREEEAKAFVDAFALLHLMNAYDSAREPRTFANIRELLKQGEGVIFSSADMQLLNLYVHSILRSGSTYLQEEFEELFLAVVEKLGKDLAASASDTHASPSNYNDVSKRIETFVHFISLIERYPLKKPEAVVNLLLEKIVRIPIFSAQREAFRRHVYEIANNISYFAKQRASSGK